MEGSLNRRLIGTPAGSETTIGAVVPEPLPAGVPISR